MRVRARALIEISEPLRAKIAQSQTLTPNRRIARALEESYGERQLAQGRRAWARPEISSLRAFVLHASERLLASTSPHVHILSPLMQRALFLSLAPARIPDPENWYRGIAEAWTLLHHYSLESDEASHLEASNTVVFREWAEAAQAALQERSLVTEAELTKLLLARIEHNQWRPDKPLIAWGFGDAHTPTPVQAKLMRHLQRLELLTRAASTPIRAAQKVPRLVEFEQPEDEFRAIALWARRCLEDAREPIAIGIAFPNVSPYRFQIERALTNLLYPQKASAPDDARLFDIAGGVPLDSLSVCGHALLFLRFLFVGVSAQDLERLIDSPFLDIAAYISPLHAPGRSWPKRVSMRDMAATNSSERARSLLALGKQARRRRPIAAWLSIFQKALETVAWPGSTHLDSLTFQHAAALGGLASELARASPFMAGRTAEEALRALERAAAGRRHEVQRTGAPIRVLDIEDASELQFTHLWVAAMRGADWPAADTANPFVPRQSQRLQGVPGVTPESRLRHARRMTAKLPACAQTLVFSYSQFDGDERHGASALLPDTIETAPDYFEGTHLRGLTAFSHPYMEDETSELVVGEERAPACGPDEREATAALVRDQSNCPFRAFAVHRLGITEASTASDLPDARTLGSAVHLALEIAYRELPDQTTLQAHEDPRGLARQAARESVEAFMPAMSRTLRAGQARLIAGIVSAWLQKDLERPAYAKLQTEVEVAVTLEGMALRLKIDRLDQDTASGQWVITDYKTSPPALTRLRASAGLHEPQLPLYAEALREARGIEVLSLAFGDTSNPEKAGYRHCSADSRLVSRPSERIAHAQAIDESTRLVRSLLADFRRGSADLAPRALACETCHLHAFCRIGAEKSA